MKRIDKLTEEFRLKYEQFITGCDSAEEIYRWNKEKNGEMDVYFENEIIYVIVRLIVADGEVDDEEVEYLNRSFGFHYTKDDIREMYRGSAEVMDESLGERLRKDVCDLDLVGKTFTVRFKELLGLICSIILESDGYAADEELDELSVIRSITEE